MYFALACEIVQNFYKNLILGELVEHRTPIL